MLTNIFRIKAAVCSSALAVRLCGRPGSLLTINPQFYRRVEL